MIEVDISTTTSAAVAAAAATTATTITTTLLQVFDNSALYDSNSVYSGAGNNSLFYTTSISLYALCNQSAWQQDPLDNCTSINGSSTSNPNSTESTVDISFILPWWRQVLWSILFGGMVIVATGGNLIVVWIVLAHKRMRTVTNYFIVNLSIADAMVSTLNVTFNYIYMLDNDWPFGEVYCKITQFTALLSLCASVFTLMAISIDRYVAIIKPLQPRMGKRSTLTVAGAIWVCSIILACPAMLFHTIAQIPSKDGIRTVCYSEWPDGPTNHSEQEYIFNILLMLFTYFVPIISMMVTYSRVGIELWGSKAIGEYTPRQVENVKSKRRVVKMMIVVVLIFAVCWLPYHIYFIVTSYYPSITEMPFTQELFLGIYWLAMSNSMYNPIIYCWMNSRFRRGFKQFFRWCPFVSLGAETLNRRDNMTSRYSCSGSPDHHRIIRNDTERSILYTCPGSPKSRRLSHCGAMRNSATIVAHRDPTRHSTPVGSLAGNAGGFHGTGTHNSSNSVSNNHHRQNVNNHEMSSMNQPSSSKDYMKTATRNNSVQLRQKWPTAMEVENPPPSYDSLTEVTTTAMPATVTTAIVDSTAVTATASTEAITPLMTQRMTALS